MKENETTKNSIKELKALLEQKNRELEIEAALERVRSRTMAMHKSDEFRETVGTLLEQLVKLDFDIQQCSLSLIDHEKKELESFQSTGILSVLPTSFKVAFPDDPRFYKMIEDGLLKQDGYTVTTYAGEEKRLFDEYVFSNSPMQFAPKEVVEFMRAKEKIILCRAHMKYGLLEVVSTEEPVSNEKAIILQRFAKVFEQTYTRFLDLQNAEAQTRKAQIEAALERVRSRTMGMQHSTELAQTALLMFEQIQTFGVDIWSCGFNIWNKEEKICTSWMSSKGILLPPMQIPLNENIAFIHFYESRLRGDSLFVDIISGETLEDHYRYMRTLPGIEEVMKIFANEKLTLPPRQINHLANFSHGNLLFRTVEPCPQLHDIFKRFAKVFEQTYIRFLDLQKAEEQAREAIKQASLDRVRGEIASMRTKDDLNQITPLIWKELIALGVPFIRCGVFIMDDENQNIHTFLSTPTGESIAAFHLPYDSPGNFTDIVSHWNQKENYIHHWGISEFQDLADVLLKNGSITNREQYMSSMPNDGINLNFVPFKQGMLYVGNTSPLAQEELQLLNSLAESFSIAYARYEDFRQLEEAKNKIEHTLTELKATQSQLIQAEKMASLGSLTAGIAHEIQNPLNFVNNFSELSNELIEELKSEKLKVKSERDEEMEDEILNDISQNLKKILHHGNRASSIVKGMLQHSRTSKGQKELTDINALADEYLRLSYHGLRAKDKSFNADFKTEFDGSLPKINVIPQDIGRVLLNLINNAFYVVDKRAKSIDPLTPEGGNKNDQIKYEPTVTVSTASFIPPSGGPRGVRISVKDNGDGINKNIVDKIFQPFFTTKPTGQGTGLGLSLSYDIVKAHGGTISVETLSADEAGKENSGTEFILTLPI